MKRTLSWSVNRREFEESAGAHLKLRGGAAAVATLEGALDAPLALHIVGAGPHAGAVEHQLPQLPAGGDETGRRFEVR